MWRVQRHHSQHPGNQPRPGKRQNPPQQNKRNLPPIDRPQLIIHQRHPQTRPRQTLRRTHRQPQPRCQQHRGRRSELHTVPPRGRQLGDPVPQRPNDVEPEEPEASPQEQARDDEDPIGGRRFGLDGAGLVGRIGRGPGPDSVGDVVGAVRDGHEHGARDLGVGPQVLDPVVISGDQGVGGLDVGGGEGHAFAGHALEEEEFGDGPEAAWVVEGEVCRGSEKALLGLDMGFAAADDSGIGFESGGVTFQVTFHGVLLFVGDGRGVGLGGRLARVAAFVVVDYNLAVRACREVDPWVVAPEGGTQGNVPPFEASVVLDETTVEVWKKEDVGNG